MSLPTGVKLDFIEFLKLAPKYFLPLLILSGLLIFSPLHFLEYLSLDEIVNKVKGFISILFLFSMAMFLSGILIKLYDYIIKIINERKISKSIKIKALRLSDRQKEILLTLLTSGKRTLSLPINDGEVVELVQYNFIYRTSTISKRHTLFDYCLQPIAEDVLRKNIHLIN